MNYRQERVGSLIQEELGKLIFKTVELEGSMITVSGVDISTKMERAVIRISVLPSEQAEKALGILQRRASDFQHDLRRTLNIKPMPFLVFEIDKGIENAARVEKALLDK